MTTGVLQKMHSSLDDTVFYHLPVGEEKVPLNSRLGTTLELEFTGNIYCANCNKKTNKSFSQGYCFPCMRKLARCDMCIMKPETCHYHQGTCREPEWGEANCFIPHYVYLANTSGLKVGITRHSQVPTRWIDQGATQAILLYQVGTRQHSGLLEVLFKQELADKTNWRAILKGQSEEIDMLSEAQGVKKKLQLQVDQLIGERQVEVTDVSAQEVTNINYPVLEYPTKIISHNFDKNPKVSGTLLGIKGQYLIFDTGVINVRKFTSYEVIVNQ